MSGDCQMDVWGVCMGPVSGGCLGGSWGCLGGLLGVFWGCLKQYDNAHPTQTRPNVFRFTIFRAVCR